MNRSLIAFIVVCLLGSVALAAVPGVINIQGILRDASNNTMPNATYNVTFRIYTASSGGTVLWTEAGSVVTTNGLFSALMGAISPVPDSVFNNPDRWLGIEVQGFAEMAPRVRLSSVGFAFEADQWVTSGQNVYRLNGNIGIGTAVPEAPLQIGDVDVAPSDGWMSLQARSTQGQLRTWQVGVFGGGTTSQQDGKFYSYSIDDMTNGSQPEFIVRWGTGNVGIGTTNPGARLHVDGGALSGTSPSGIEFAYDVAGGKIQSYGTKPLILNPLGNNVSIGGTNSSVGIGGTNSSDRLYVYTNDGRTAIEGNADGGGFGVSGSADGAGSSAIYGYTGNDAAYAGHFDGDVIIIGGTLIGGSATTKIDHPLAPADKYLSHSVVQSADMKNIYDGTVTLDPKGEAVIALPDWFGALNKDFRYQLTAVGAPGPNLHVSQKLMNNRFHIAGGSSGMEVSWQITGIRQDVYANANRVLVEELKPAVERGFYLYPKLLSQPEEKGIEWARHPEMMKKTKEEREKAKAGGE